MLARAGAVFWIVLVLVSLAESAAGQAALPGDKLRASAAETRKQAATQKTLAEAYRRQADRVRTRAAEARKQAAAARKAGKTDRAVALEQQARSDDNEVLRRLDQATSHQREADDLERSAQAKEEAARRMDQEALPVDRYAELYQRTRTLLLRLKASNAELRAAASGWIGREYDGGVNRFAKFTKEHENALFPAVAESAAAPDALEQAWEKFKTGKSTGDEFAVYCYNAAYNGVFAHVDLQFRYAGQEVLFLAGECGRTDLRLGEESAAERAVINGDYAAKKFSVFEWEARLAARAERESQKRRLLFESVAQPYRTIMIRLARMRRALLPELKEWQDFAAASSKAAKDIHAEWAGYFENASFRLFSPEAGLRSQMNYAGFAFRPGSPDRLNTRCDSGLKWLTPTLHPDIHDGNGQFRMTRLGELKLPDSVNSGRAAGAAANETP